MSANIFISFASQDLKIANTICAAIEGRGFKCWISSRDILPGENFQSAIVRAIRGSRIMLLVFTGNSNRSEEMTKELALASQQKLMVVPLRVEDVTPSDAFAYEFATRQWIDLFADWEQAMNQLCSRIAAALANEPHSTEPIVLGKPSADMTAAAPAASAPLVQAATKGTAPLPFANAGKTAAKNGKPATAAPVQRKRVIGIAAAVAVLAGAGIAIGALSGKNGSGVAPAADAAPTARTVSAPAAGDASQSAASLVVAAADTSAAAPAPAVAAPEASPTDTPAVAAAATATTARPATSAADEAAKAALRKKRLANKARASSNVPY